MSSRFAAITGTGSYVPEHVITNAELAARSVGHDRDAQESVEEIRSAAQRAAELTRQMLAYSGRAELTVKPVDLSAVVSEMASLLASVISKKATVRYERAAGLPLVLKGQA